MSQTDMRLLGSVEDVMSAVADGKPVDLFDRILMKWISLTLPVMDYEISDLLRCGARFRIASPSEPQGTRDVRAWVSEMKLSGDRVEYWVCVGHGRERGEYLSVRVSSIKGRTEYEVAEWNHMLGHGPEPDIFAYETDAPATAPPAAPAGASTPTIPSVDDLIRVAIEGLRSIECPWIDIPATGAICRAIHAKYFAGVRDGEGS